MSILEQFIDYGLTSLIPLSADIRTGELYEEEGIPMWDGEFGERNPFEKDDTDGFGRDELFCCREDEETEDEETEEEEEKEEEDTEEPGVDLTDIRPDSLNELKEWFAFEEVSDDDFLAMSPADLFGVSDNQMKFIRFDCLDDADLCTFACKMRDPEIIASFPDIRQRIRYATVTSVFNMQSISPKDPDDNEDDPPNVRISRHVKFRRELDTYLKRIIVSRSEDEAFAILHLLKDYYTMLSYGMSMNEWRRAHGIRELKYEIFPKPSRLRDMHDKAARDMIAATAMEQEIEKERAAALDEQIKDVVRTKTYRKYLKEGKSFSVIAAQNCESLQKEGAALGHCVAGYRENFAKGISLIYFLRETDAPQVPFYTLEIGALGDGSGRFALKQCFTQNNSIKKSPECRKFILDWAEEKKLKVACTV